MNISRIKKETERITKQANFNLRRDVLTALQKACSKERNKKAKLALGWILENAKIARKEELAICQDTGLPVIFIEAGLEITVSSELVEAIKQAVESAYRKFYLRKSLVNPLHRKNSGYRGAITHLEFNRKLTGLKITVFPKGFGSENKSRLKMFDPTAGYEEIENFVVESVRLAGPESCPPFIVGVGIGGVSDSALLLAKKALIEKINKPNPDKSLALLERRILKKINSLNIGPMGLGGKVSALAVKVKILPTHIAGLPVGVNISCWALRSADLRIKA